MDTQGRFTFLYVTSPASPTLRWPIFFSRSIRDIPDRVLGERGVLGPSADPGSGSIVTYNENKNERSG